MSTYPKVATFREAESHQQSTANHKYSQVMIDYPRYENGFEDIQSRAYHPGSKNYVHPMQRNFDGRPDTFFQSKSDINNPTNLKQKIPLNNSSLTRQPSYYISDEEDDRFENQLTSKSRNIPPTLLGEGPSSEGLSTYGSGSEIASNSIVYKVHFKNSSGYYCFYGNNSANLPTLQVGEFVKVAADRGEDLGVVADFFPMQDWLARKHTQRKIDVKDDNQKIGRIIRVAVPTERYQLQEKHRREMEVIEVCKELAQRVHRLPIAVLNAAFQFDGNKLTIFYASNARVDFREFVRDLFAIYKARIWMEKVLLANPSGASTSALDYALETGQFVFQRSPQPSHPQQTDVHFQQQQQAELSSQRHLLSQSSRHSNSGGGGSNHGSFHGSNSGVNGQGSFHGAGGVISNHGSFHNPGSFHGPSSQSGSFHGPSSFHGTNSQPSSFHGPSNASSFYGSSGHGGSFHGSSHAGNDDKEGMAPTPQLTMSMLLAPYPPRTPFK